MNLEWPIVYIERSQVNCFQVKLPYFSEGWVVVILANSVDPDDRCIIEESLFI